MEEEVILIDINQSLDYLSHNLILYSTSLNKLSYFKLENDHIVVIENNISMKISIETFKELYKEFKFSVLDKKDEISIDPLKDEEYYSMKHK